MFARRLPALVVVVALFVLAGGSSLVHGQTRPAAPTLQVDGTTIHASWGTPAGPRPSVYHVQKAVKGSGQWQSAGSTGGNSHSLDDLESNTDYAVRYRARQAGANGPWSTTAYATTGTAGSPPGPPGPPVVTANAGNGEVTLTWTEPSDTGCEGCIVDLYRSRHRVRDGGSWGTPRTTTRRYRLVRDLVNGTEYEFRVRAANSESGWGEWATVYATPEAPGAITVPGAPQELEATPKDTAVRLDWLPPADTGGAPVEGYQVELTVGGTGWRDATRVDVASTNFVFNYLTNGTEYVGRVRAVNSAGAGDWSTAARTTPNGPAESETPTAPRGLGLWPGDGEINALWSSPQRGIVLGYHLEYRMNGGTWIRHGGLIDKEVTREGNTDGIDITGLTNGTTYEVRVRAVGRPTSTNHGPWSDPVSTMPGTEPGAPTNVQGTPGDSQVALTWNEPADDGGNSIFSYDIEQTTDTSPTEDSWQPAGTTYVDGGRTFVVGLQNGTAYRFRVRARNDLGAGTASEPSEAATPMAMTPPDNVALAIAGANSIEVTWNAPAEAADQVAQYRIRWAIKGGGWRQGPGKSGFVGGINSDTTEWTLDELASDTHYAVGVSAQARIYGQGGQIIYRWTPWTQTEYLMLHETALPSGVVSGDVGTAPTDLRVEPVAGGLMASWEPPIAGEPVDGYLVEYAERASTEWIDAGHAGLEARALVGGLLDGVEYQARVTAITTSGSGGVTRACCTAVLPVVPALPLGFLLFGAGLVSWVFRRQLGRRAASCSGEIR